MGKGSQRPTMTNQPETKPMTIEQHKDFLANFQAERIEHDQKIAAAREKIEAMLTELRAFDIETNNAFNKGAIK